MTPDLSVPCNEEGGMHNALVLHTSVGVKITAWRKTMR